MLKPCKVNYFLLFGQTLKIKNHVLFCPSQFLAYLRKPKETDMNDFIHLHVHTYYSILDGQSKISKLVDKAIADDMKGHHRPWCHVWH